MMTVQEQDDVQLETIASWWQSVRQHVGNFEGLYSHAPQTVVDKGSASETIHRLMTIYQSVQQLPYPDVAESAQRHFINSVLHLRLSIEEAVRQHPERSNRYYAQAHNQLRRLKNRLENYGINDIGI